MRQSRASLANRVQISRSESPVCSDAADITMTRDEVLALFARRQKAIVLRDGHIVHERRIYDFTGILVQVGLLKAKPA